MSNKKKVSEDLEDFQIIELDDVNKKIPSKAGDKEAGEESEEFSQTQECIILDEEESGIGTLIKSVLKYMAVVAVSIIYWELLMIFMQKAFSLSFLFFLFFVPAEALFFAAFCGVGNEKTARITLPIVLVLPTIWYGAQIIYYRNFGSLFSVSMAGMGNDAVGDFGWAVEDAVEGAVILMLLLFVPLILTIVFSIRDTFKLRSYSWWMHLLALLASVLLWLLSTVCIRCLGTDRQSTYYLLTNSMATTDASAKRLGVMTTGIVEGGAYYFGIGNSDEAQFVYDDEEDTQLVVVDSLTAEEEEGELENETEYTPWINEKIDFARVSGASNDSEINGVSDFLNKRDASYTNEYTGMFEGYNLIYICAESFWSYGCNEDVTPTLYKMAHNGIVLNNYYNSFYNTTTNGEFAFCTSLWPDVSRNSKNGTDIGSFAQSSTKYMPQGLGDLFSSQGIPSYAYHNYYGKYYRRILSWPNLGYKCRFTGDNMWFSSNWPASDLELVEQTVDDYKNDKQFHTYYMTFSGHGPYTSKNQMFNKNIGAVTAITGEEKYNSMARGYLAGELELDRAMEYLLNSLEEAGVLDKTVIVLTGDHYPYYLDEEGRTSLCGEVMDEDFEIYHSNCIIYNAAMKEPIEVDDYCCNVDIAPTILNLFNIPFDSRLMMGRDIFSPQAHNRATLYNMSFVSEYVKYNFETGEAVWSDKGNELSPEEKEKYIRTQLNSIENEYTASCRIIEDNYYFELYKLCGILSADEIAKEEQRESTAQSQDDDFNMEDEMKKAEKEAEEAAEQALALQREQLRQLGFTEEQINQMIDTGTVPAIGPDGNLIVQTVPATTDTGIVVDPLAAPGDVADPNAAVPVVVNPEGDATVVTDPNAAAPGVDSPVVETVDNTAVVTVTQ